MICKTERIPQEFLFCSLFQNRAAGGDNFLCLSSSPSIWHFQLPDREGICSRLCLRRKLISRRRVILSSVSYQGSSNCWAPSCATGRSAALLPPSCPSCCSGGRPRWHKTRRHAWASATQPTAEGASSVTVARHQIRAGAQPCA